MIGNYALNLNVNVPAEETSRYARVSGYLTKKENALSHMFFHDGFNVDGMQVVSGFLNIVFHLVTRVQKCEKIKGRPIDEEIRPVGAANESFSLRLIVPIHCAFHHKTRFLK
jgi:hypothetical protein